MTAAALFAARRRRHLTRLGALGVALGLAVIVAAGTGAMRIAPATVVGALAEAVGLSTPWATAPDEAAVLWAIRLPRVVLAALVGAALAVTGALCQGLFRNPLADPGLVGVASGAALGASAVIVLGVGAALPLTVALPAAAFLGGVLFTVLAHRVAVRGGRTDVATLLLAGIGLNAVGFAGLGLLTFVADDAQLRGLTFWLLGSLGGATWPAVAAAAPGLVLPVVLAAWLARPLDALVLGETEAAHLGVPVERVRRAVVALVALGVGAAVAVTGIIGFVGLVVPQGVRLLAGPDHRVTLPGSALAGAALLVGADAVARTVAAPAEVPVGVVTTLIGAPAFLTLLWGRRS